MPFGLCKAQTTFQQVVLAGLEWTAVSSTAMIFLLPLSLFEEHMRHLQLVFERLHQAGLWLKPKKYLFLHERVPYLGLVCEHRIQLHLPKILRTF